LRDKLKSEEFVSNQPDSVTSRFAFLGIRPIKTAQRSRSHVDPSLFVYLFIWAYNSETEFYRRNLPFATLIVRMRSEHILWIYFPYGHIH